MGTCDSAPSQNKFSNDLQPVRKDKFNPFYEPNAQQLNQHQVLNNYTFLSNYQDRFFGRCSVLADKNTNDHYLAKDLVFSDAAQCEYEYKKLKNIKEKEQKSQDVLRIKEIFTKKIDGFLFDDNKVTILIEYPLTTLKKQFSNRMLNKLQFTKQQITNILYSLISGYATIERAGSLNDKVRMAHIFVGVQNKQSVIKTIDAGLLPGPSNLKCIQQYGIQSNQHHDVYLAPEEFQAFCNKDFKEHVSTQRSGVFSLGMLILDLCLMDSSSIVYHYHQKKVSQAEINNFIGIAGKKHGFNIESLLKEMLEFNPVKRPNFVQLQAKIPKIFSQKSINVNPLRLSVVNDENSRFLKNDSKSLRDSRISNNSSVSLSRLRSPSRMFASSIKVQKPEEQQLQRIHEEYTNGNQYIGEKKGGNKHGMGKYIFKDRSYYQGSWKNNKMHGKGQLYFSNGKLEYDGEWKEDQPNGWGVLNSNDSGQNYWIKYEGELNCGQMDGRGKLTFTNGTVYQGQFRNGKIFGKGRRIESNGLVLEKEWSLKSPDEFIIDRSAPVNQSIIVQ